MRSFLNYIFKGVVISELFLPFIIMFQFNSWNSLLCASRRATQLRSRRHLVPQIFALTDRRSNPFAFPWSRAFLPLRYLGFTSILQILRYTHFLRALKRREKNYKFLVAIFLVYVLAWIFARLTKVSVFLILPIEELGSRVLLKGRKKIAGKYCMLRIYIFQCATTNFRTFPARFSGMKIPSEVQKGTQSP